MCLTSYPSGEVASLARDGPGCCSLRLGVVPCPRVSRRAALHRRYSTVHESGRLGHPQDIVLATRVQRDGSRPATGGLEARTAPPPPEGFLLGSAFMPPPEGLAESSSRFKTWPPERERLSPGLLHLAADFSWIVGSSDGARTVSKCWEAGPARGRTACGGPPGSRSCSSHSLASVNQQCACVSVHGKREQSVVGFGR